jgi:cell wall-associated NlpC family hydrolase
MFKKINFCLIIGAALFCGPFIKAQNPNQAIYSNTIKWSLPTNKAERLVTVAKTFLGKPYVAYTLEENQEERLIVNLKEFDCSTLVESALAITETAKPDYAQYQKKLTDIRYRNGVIKGYGSRLHYLTDWLLENEKNGIFKLETKNMGGIPFKKEINFMSTHIDKYPRANTTALKNEIKQAESDLNSKSLYYIPKENITKIEHLIKQGDIIAITTSIGGLDCSHQGIAIVKNGKVYLMHASSKMKKVIVSSEPLLEYLSKNKSQSGIMVARLQ